MTRFFVDRMEILPPPTGISSLHEVLEHVERTYLHRDNVIRQVQVDGLPVLSEGTGNIPADFLAGIEGRERIEISTGSLLEIARESVTEAVSYLDRIENIIPSLASSFQDYPKPEAFQNLKELYTGFYWLNILLDRLKSRLGTDFSDLLLKGIPLRDHQRSFLSALQQLVDSQARADFVLVADLLEYEILPIIPVWKELFAIIAQKMETDSAI